MIPANFIKVFSPRGFTSRGVILAWERTRASACMSVPRCGVCVRACVYTSPFLPHLTIVYCPHHHHNLSIPLYPLVKLTPRQPKAMRIIIVTGMLTLNHRNSLREALHCVYVSLVYKCTCAFGDGLLSVIRSSPQLRGIEMYVRGQTIGTCPLYRGCPVQGCPRGSTVHVYKQLTAGHF